MWEIRVSIHFSNELRRPVMHWCNILNGSRRYLVSLSFLQSVLYKWQGSPLLQILPRACDHLSIIQKDLDPVLAYQERRSMSGWFTSLFRTIQAVRTRSLSCRKEKANWYQYIIHFVQYSIQPYFPQWQTRRYCVMKRIVGRSNCIITLEMDWNHGSDSKNHRLPVAVLHLLQH